MATLTSKLFTEIPARVIGEVHHDQQTIDIRAINDELTEISEKFPEIERKIEEAGSKVKIIYHK